MQTISDESMKAAYELGKRVHHGSLTTSAAVSELKERFGLNHSSATDTIRNVGHMLRGKRYTRTNSAFATEHFLERIYLDYGPSQLETAISAVEKHVEYYGQLPTGGKLQKVSLIVQKYRGIANEARNSAVAPPSTGSGIRSDLDEIERDPVADLTTKQTLVDARLGQGKFREVVLRSWGNRCSVTGSRIEAAIRASHIKPWREANNAERLDPDNGLPLIASLDVLFDAGLISFASSGKLNASKAVDTSERSIYGIRNLFLRRRPTAKMMEYLAYHRSKHGFSDEE